MPKIVVKNLDNKVISTQDNNKTILAILQSDFVDWMHACGGKGRCTTCKAMIIEGEENLAPRTAPENRFYEMKALKENERLTCQCTVLDGEVVIQVPEAGKLPHIKYS